MGILDGIEQLDPPDGGQYLGTGSCTCRINSCKLDNKQDGALFFAAELVVTDPGTTDHREGDVVSYFREFRYPDSTKREIAGLYYAGFGNKLGREIGRGDLDKASADSVTSDKQPLAGAEVHCFGWQKPGKQYTHYKFRPAGVEAPFGADA